MIARARGYISRVAYSISSTRIVYEKQVCLSCALPGVINTGLQVMYPVESVHRTLHMYAIEPIAYTTSCGSWKGVDHLVHNIINNYSTINR